MKKKFFSLIVTLGLTTAATLHASDGYATFGLSAGIADMDGIEGTEYSLDIGTNWILGENVLFGFSSNVQFISLDQIGPSGSYSDTVAGVSADLKVGYVFTQSTIKGLSVYGIGTMGIIDKSYGFGGGAGVSYPVANHWLVAAEYKTLGMTNADIDYDYTYSVSKIFIKYKY